MNANIFMVKYDMVFKDVENMRIFYLYIHICIYICNICNIYICIY